MCFHSERRSHELFTRLLVYCCCTFCFRISFWASLTGYYAGHGPSFQQNYPLTTRLNTSDDIPYCCMFSLSNCHRRKMEQMSDKFRWEVQEVKRMEKVVRARQHRIAHANLCACCAIIIQATWRTYQAKMLARKQRGLRLSMMLAQWWRR